MKRLLALLMALALGAPLMAEDAPKDCIDMMYVGLDKIVFGRPTLSGPINMSGAQTIIRLNLEQANYRVAVAINTDNNTPDKVSVIRNMLTPWLLNLGAREVYFRSSVTGDPIGAPVKTLKPEEGPAESHSAIAPAAPAPAPVAKTPAAAPAP
ncbi:MAG: hypothetical protein J6333_08745, partial [Planctomycetes bacterium]|nr:hypothetical protein [Planctomycetota bacterium]